MSMTKLLKDYSVLTFDCYGTLIDWETGIWDAFQPLIVNDHHRSKNLKRNNILESFAKNESRIQHEQPTIPYPVLLANVHRLVADEFALKTTQDMDKAFASSVPHWPAFPDSADSLRELSQYYKLVILSNIDNESFAASNRKLGVAFDAVYTAETIGSYKPSARNFEYLLENLHEQFNFDRDDILHTAQSLYHDHVPARQHNLANAWIDRQNLADAANWGATLEVNRQPEYDFIYSSLAEMVNALRAELA